MYFFCNAVRIFCLRAIEKGPLETAVVAAAAAAMLLRALYTSARSIAYIFFSNSKLDIAAAAAAPLDAHLLTDKDSPLLLLLHAKSITVQG